MRKFKKVFITGITGSGGSYLAEHIDKKNQGVKIYGSYRSTGYKDLLKKNISKIKLYKLDLNNYSQTKKILALVKPDVIFHLASNANVRESFDQPKQIIENNNLITLNLLEAVREQKIDPLILICSSSEVYGQVKDADLPINETQRINPVNPYAASKAFQDIVSQVYYKSFNLKIIITRMFSYTNARRLNLFQTSFANQIALIEKNKKKILSHGNLKSVRSFIDIEDAMEAYWVAATKGKMGEIYNISGTEIISVKNFLNKLIKLSYKMIKTKPNKKLFRPQDISLQIPNSKKFKKHTSWQPKVSLEDSIIKLLDECRASIE